MIIRDPIISERYAQAMFNIAKREGAVAQVMADIEQLFAATYPREKMRRFFDTSMVSKSVKLQFIEKVFGGRAHPLLLELLKLLLVKGRLMLLHPILQCFRILAQRDQGFYEAEVATAVELDENQQNRVHSTLEAFAKVKLKIRHVVDPRLIAGIRVTYGDLLIDDTVQDKMKEIRECMERRINV